MPVRTLRNLDELRTLVGQELGVSDWIEVSQSQIDAFAEATGDRQWIHCDRERSRRESLYGTTIAHGFLTLSLGPALAMSVFRVEGVQWVVNYGVNRVRFPAPVRSGSRLRLRLALVGVEDFVGGLQVTVKQTFEVEGQDKPVCVAEAVLRLYNK
jgi:acyl dehydratase